MLADQLDTLTATAAVSLPCHDQDPELFFAADPAEVETAKQVCGPCPLARECLEGALRRREPHGVWGGQLLVEGEVVARKRPRGRPRKTPAVCEPPSPIAARAAQQDPPQAAPEAA